MMDRWKIGMIAAFLSIIPTFQRSLAAQDTLPAGYGSLRRDEVVIRFSTGTLEIQVLPLDEQVIRLLAPDTYRSLAALLRARKTELDRAAARAGITAPAIWMVTFFGVVPQARFTPDEVNITSRGRLFRPLGIVPIAPQWQSQQLEAREQAAALYVFDDGIGLSEQLTVSYQGQSNDAWARAVPVLERERARFLARAKP